MVSSKPVPSRAALNALRGLVFTTSCSVFILAEERRQRMRIARSAFDNARKLHTVKARHRPALLADTRLSDEDCEALLIERISKPERRKRRPRLRSRSDDSDVHSKEKNLMQDLEIKGNDRIDLPSRSARSSSSSTNPRVTVDLPIIGQKPDAPPIRSTVSSRDTFSRPKLGKPISPASQSSRPKVPHTNHHAKPRIPADFQVGMATLTVAAPSSSKSYERPFVGAFSTMDSSLTQAVTDFLGRASGAETTFDSTVLPLLNKLLVEFDPRDWSVAGTSSRLNMALEIFDKLSHVTATGLHAEAMEANSVALIKVAILLGEHQVSALNSTRRFHKDVHKVLAVVLDWMMEANIADRVPSFLGEFCNSECSLDQLDSKAIYRILVSHSTLYQKPSRTIELYHMLHSPRLPSNSQSTLEGDFETRQLVSYLLQDEMQRRGIYQAVHFPAPYQSGAQGDGSEASRRQFQGILANLVDTCSRRHAPANFEAIVRYLTQTHGLELQGRWVYSLLTRYFRSNGLDTVFAWIQFCLQNNFRVDDAYILKFYQKCHTNWDMSWEKVNKLASLLRKANHNYTLADCTKAISPSAEKDGTPSSRQSVPAREDWERLYVRVARGLAPSPLSKEETDVFDSMQRYARESKWSLVWESYEKFRSTSSQKFSIRCLRLAVLARVRLDGGSTDNASRLLWSCSQGHDVSDAATSVLMAKLANGEPPISIIRDALGRGLRVHDMVYNLAARKTIALGHLADALRICQMAISQNGCGDFLYQEFIFLNLVSIHILQLHYSDLKLLLAALMEKKPNWVGTEAIKRTLKLNMKTVVKRIAMASGSASSPHTEALSLLDMALQFNSERTERYAPSTRSNTDINSNMGNVFQSEYEVVSSRPPKEINDGSSLSTLPNDVGDAQQFSEARTGDAITPHKLSNTLDTETVMTAQTPQGTIPLGPNTKPADEKFQENMGIPAEKKPQQEAVQRPDPNWDYFSEMEGNAIRSRDIFPKEKPKNLPAKQNAKDDGVPTKLNGDNAREISSGIASSESRSLLTGEKKMMYEFLSLQPRVVPSWSQCEVGHES
ncbi:unnamed protein product [Clonostachys rhizophaga]|uniref:Uncharacterized protein n=1 Tax=Clonostachys rhizophaga TaxID=160324 RepID=A0A9N9UXN9_9HYPO|nr:unnamed protein product [Clonostachys rhizophaga]